MLWSTTGCTTMCIGTSCGWVFVQLTFFLIRFSSPPLVEKYVDTFKSVTNSSVFSLLLLFQMSKKRFRAAATLFVFTVSAVVHEYVLAICFGFFYPVLFCLFMCFGSKSSVFPQSENRSHSHFNPLVIVMHLTPSSSFLILLQWCSTLFSMTKGKGRSGT